MKQREEPQKRKTAEELLSPGQQVLACTLLALAVAEGVAFGPLTLLRTAVALIITFYVIFVGFKIVLWAAARPSARPSEIREETAGTAWGSLPKLSIEVPLRNEVRVLEQLRRALTSLQYPIHKLQILILVDEDDTETLAAVWQLKLPDYYKVIVVPDIGPRTKPKACSYGYRFVEGEIVVVFDGEDQQEFDQAMHAARQFTTQRHRKRPIGCIQATLSFWNPRSSWVSTCYWAEYLVHFTQVLPGLARLGLVPPLGGTSNYLLKKALDKVTAANGDFVFTDSRGRTLVIRGPWDPSNLTEDADLSPRLVKAGYSIVMLASPSGHSVTYEAAPHQLSKARNQRKRWLKGYAQTGLVHTRRPIQGMREMGILPWLAFNLHMLGTPLALLLNPVMWGTTVLYVIARLDSLSAVSTFIDGLFPSPVYYMGMVVAIGGNAALYFQKLSMPLFAQWRAENDQTAQHELAALLQKQEYGLVSRLLLTPFWWAFTSVSAYLAVWELCTPSKRLHWAKTDHRPDIEVAADLA